MLKSDWCLVLGVFDLYNRSSKVVHFPVYVKGIIFYAHALFISTIFIFTLNHLLHIGSLSVILISVISLKLCSWTLLCSAVLVFLFLFRVYLICSSLSDSQEIYFVCLIRDRIKSMFYHAYNNYLENAYPYDELRPLTCDGQDTWGRYEHPTVWVYFTEWHYLI